MMNIHIDRYVMVNMQGLQQLVDAVGWDHRQQYTRFPDFDC